MEKEVIESGKSDVLLELELKLTHQLKNLMIQVANLKTQIMCLAYLEQLNGCNSEALKALGGPEVIQNVKKRIEDAKLAVKSAEELVEEARVELNKVKKVS